MPHHNVDPGPNIRLNPGESGRHITSPFAAFARRSADLPLRSLMGHNVDKFVRSRQPSLLIHPADAIARGIEDGGRARVTSSAGSTEVAVQVSESVVPGAVCCPHGWGHRGGNWQRANAAEGANVNLLADAAAGDRLSASSLLEGIIIEIERA